MSSISKSTIKSCLLESTMQEIKTIESMEYSAITATKAYRARINSTISNNTKAKRKNTPKKMFLIFVAAILISLAVMFTVSADIRQAVADFFVNVYETFTEFFVANENETINDTQNSTPSSKPNPATIEIEYKPSYIDENGYSEIDKVIQATQIFTVWTNGVEMVDLLQHTADNTGITLDTENTSYETKDVGGQTVYYLLKNNVYFVQWLEYGYSFSLSCDESLGWDEVEKIILSIEPVDE